MGCPGNRSPRRGTRVYRTGKPAIFHVYISAFVIVLQELYLLCIGTGEGFPFAGGYLWDYDNVKTFCVKLLITEIISFDIKDTLTFLRHDGLLIPGFWDPQ